MPTAILFYDVVLAVHVTAVILAFGVTFAYPILGGQMRRLAPAAVPAWHRAQGMVGSRLIGPAGGLAFAAGIYLAADRHLFGEIWVQIPMVILIVLLALGGAYFSPTERKLAALAERDVAAGTGDGIRWSPEYEALHRQWQTVAAIGPGLVIVAVFLMVTKPGA